MIARFCCRLGVAVSGFVSGACETIRETDEQATDRMNAQGVTIEQLVENPMNNQWVRVAGWLAEPPFRLEIELCAFKTGFSDSVAAFETPCIGVRKSELSAPLSRSLGGRKVIVTGRVDTRCPETHYWANSEMERNPDFIVMASGYCHATDLIHLDYAVIEPAGAEQ